MEIDIAFLDRVVVGALAGLLVPVVMYLSTSEGLRARLIPLCLVCPGVLGIVAYLGGQVAVAGAVASILVINLMMAYLQGELSAPGREKAPN